MAGSSIQLDPRVQRTRLYLRKAFIELVQEKGLQQVTVTDLTERALINRSTFYLHYRDIEDLMTTGFQEYWDQVLPGSTLFIYHKPVLLRDQLQAQIEADLRHFDELRGFYRLTLCEEENTAFRDHLFDHLLKITRQRFSPPYSLSDTPALPLPLVYTWIASAYLGVIFEWLEAERSETPSEYAPLLAQLFIQTIQESIHIPISGAMNNPREEAFLPGIVS